MTLKSAFAAGAIISVAMIGSASAMPAASIGITAQAAPGIQSGLQDVRWICGPFRCWWRPGPVWWGPHPGWGWHRRFYWHRGWRW